MKKHKFYVQTRIRLLNMYSSKITVCDIYPLQTIMLISGIKIFRVLVQVKFDILNIVHHKQNMLHM